MVNKKIVLVTGASRGIGEAIALLLAQHDYMVIGTATTSIGVEHITQLLLPFNGIGILLDVSNSIMIDEVIKNIMKTYGSIDILINNAGITKDNLLMRMAENVWDDVMSINLKSVFMLSKLVIRDMMKKRWGRIINITSVIASIGNAGQTNYAASKAGIEAFSKSLAKEIGSRNITVNCIAPGFIQTQMTEELTDEIKQQYEKLIPLQRLGKVNDIAYAVKFLISNEAEYITGNVLHINGGLYM